MVPSPAWALTALRCPPKPSTDAAIIAPRPSPTPKANSPTTSLTVCPAVSIFACTVFHDRLLNLHLRGFISRDGSTSAKHSPQAPQQRKIPWEPCRDGAWTSHVDECWRRTPHPRRSHMRRVRNDRTSSAASPFDWVGGRGVYPAGFCRTKSRSEVLGWRRSKRSKQLATLQSEIISSTVNNDVSQHCRAHRDSATAACELKDWVLWKCQRAQAQSFVVDPALDRNTAPGHRIEQ